MAPSHLSQFPLIDILDILEAMADCDKLYLCSPCSFAYFSQILDREIEGEVAAAAKDIIS